MNYVLGTLDFQCRGHKPGAQHSRKTRRKKTHHENVKTRMYDGLSSSYKVVISLSPAAVTPSLSKHSTQLLPTAGGNSAMKGKQFCNIYSRATGRRRFTRFTASPFLIHHVQTLKTQSMNLPCQILTFFSKV